MNTSDRNAWITFAVSAIAIALIVFGISATGASGLTDGANSVQSYDPSYPSYSTQTPGFGQSDPTPSGDQTQNTYPTDSSSSSSDWATSFPDGTDPQCTDQPDSDMYRTETGNPGSFVSCVFAQQVYDGFNANNDGTNVATYTVIDAADNEKSGHVYSVSCQPNGGYIVCQWTDTTDTSSQTGSTEYILGS